MNWPTGLDKKPLQARGLYTVITLATVIGLTLNFPAVQRVTHLSPIKALFWSAVCNGVVAVPIMFTMMHMCHNRKVFGRFVDISRTLRVMGWLATIVMLFAAIGMFITSF